MYTLGIMKLGLSILFFLTLHGAAKDLIIPNFSQGLQGAKLEKKDESGDQVVFHFKTELSSKKISAILKKKLGPAWKTQKLKQEDMILAARRGRSSGAEVNLTVYHHATDKDVRVRVIHLKPKNGANRLVEIAVIQEVGNAKNAERREGG